jgi:hypothetical protein
MPQVVRINGPIQFQLLRQGRWALRRLGFGALGFPKCLLAKDLTYRKLASFRR